MKQDHILLLIRSGLLRAGLTMPPRWLMDRESKAIDAICGKQLPCKLDQIIVNRLVDCRAEFADPKIILADVKDWHTQERGRELSRIPYANFLRTWYWIALSSHVVISAGCCQKCKVTIGSLQPGSSLQVHHLTYQFRGFEVFRLADLTVECDFCHARSHNKWPRQKIVGLGQMFAG
jgi:hypothetical protein